MKFEIDRLKYNSRDHQSFYRYKKKLNKNMPNNIDVSFEKIIFNRCTVISKIYHRATSYGTKIFENEITTRYQAWNTSR